MSRQVSKYGSFATQDKQTIRPQLAKLLQQTPNPKLNAEPKKLDNEAVGFGLEGVKSLSKVIRWNPPSAASHQRKDKVDEIDRQARSFAQTKTKKSGRQSQRRRQAVAVRVRVTTVGPVCLHIIACGRKVIEAAGSQSLSSSHHARGGAQGESQSQGPHAYWFPLHMENFPRHARPGCD